jgi:opacity protein-like surface antigen
LPDLLRGCTALLAATLVFAGEAAVAEQGEPSEFARTGPYLGIGGTFAFPTDWDTDLDNDMNEEATELANEAAMGSFDALPPATTAGYNLVPLEIKVDGADFEDGLLGVNALVGYRVAENVAFELEGEWLTESSESDLDVTGSTGRHRAEVKDIWTLTTNVKIYPFTGRFQPFAVGGVGLQQSKLDVDIVTSGVTTEALNPQPPPDPPLVLPDIGADFRIRKRNSKVDGAVRVGGGIDVYATSNIVGSLSVTYVHPFSQVGTLRTDYVSLVWRVLYRF